MGGEIGVTINGKNITIGYHYADGIFHVLNKEVFNKLYKDKDLEKFKENYKIKEILYEYPDGTTENIRWFKNGKLEN